VETSPEGPEAVVTTAMGFGVALIGPKMCLSEHIGICAEASGGAGSPVMPTNSDEPTRPSERVPTLLRVGAEAPRQPGGLAPCSSPEAPNSRRGP
jgi:hypothetical protein